MSFQSYTFLFLLLPVAVAVWWLLNWRGHGKLAQGFLLLVSLAFYGKARLHSCPFCWKASFLIFGSAKVCKPSPVVKRGSWRWAYWAT